MQNENEFNWIRGMEIIKHDLACIVDSNEVGADNKLEDAFDTWKSMHGGNGSFSDFYIWRDDFNEREKYNLNLNDIKGKIWETFKELGFEK